MVRITSKQPPHRQDDGTTGPPEHWATGRLDHGSTGPRTGRAQLSQALSQGSHRSPGGSTTDAAALAAKLRCKIKGEVRFSNGDRALYATDGSNYRQVPIGVVLPCGTEDILETFAL